MAGEDDPLEGLDLMKRVGILDDEDVEPYIQRDTDTTTDEKIKLLVEAGFLTERQAAAYVYQRIGGLSREEAARELDVEKTTLDDYRGAAEEKLRKAKLTVDVMEVIDDGW